MEGLPASKRFDLVGHAKAVTTLEADAAGSRLIAGGNDYMVSEGGGRGRCRVLMETEGAAGCRSLRLFAANPALAAPTLPVQVHVWDFGGLKADGKSFRSFEPADGYPVVAASWSPTGDAFLIAMSNSQVGGWAGGSGLESMPRVPRLDPCRCRPLSTASSF